MSYDHFAVLNRITMNSGAREFERGESVPSDDVSGFVVLLDENMNEVVTRQECRFRWKLFPGGATWKVTTQHQFELSHSSVTYVAVGAKDTFMFISIVVGHPINSGTFLLGV